MNELERGYRRLLALYPRDHRESHGEEMLGVLLDGKRTGPSVAETADLLRGAAKLHLRRVAGLDGGIRHRDVLAIVSLLGPFAVLIGALPAMRELASALQRGWLLWEWRWEVPELSAWSVWLVVAGLVVFRLRRTAAAGAWLGTVGLVAVPLIDPYPASSWLVAHAGSVLSGLVVAAALTWSPGPARGRELVGGKRFASFATLVPAAVVVLGLALGGSGVGDLPLDAAGLAVLAAGAVVAGGVRSRSGRRAALVLVLPVVSPVIVDRVLQHVVPVNLTQNTVALSWFGIVVLALLAVAGPPRRVARGSA